LKREYIYIAVLFWLRVLCYCLFYVWWLLITAELW